jgi:hypothetical protein
MSTIIFISFPGDVNEALDYYSKGVTELEKGVSYSVHAQGTIIIHEAPENKFSGKGVWHFNVHIIYVTRGSK